MQRSAEKGIKMAFGELAAEIKKAPALKAEKKDISYADQSEIRDFTGPAKRLFCSDSEIQGFAPQQRAFGSRTSSDPKHGSIIKTIASQSSQNQQSGGNAKWDECRYLKKSDFGKDYCTEYHSICAKDNCRRARK